MKTSKKLIIGALLLAAGVAFAAAPPTKLLFAWVTGRLNVGSTYTEANGLTFIGNGCIPMDFGAIGAGAVNCEEGGNIAVVTGAKMGHTCAAATNLGMDGGAGLSLEADISCRVTAANAVKFRACAYRADAGALDLPDAGFCATVFGNF